MQGLRQLLLLSSSCEFERGMEAAEVEGAGRRPKVEENCRGAAVRGGGGGADVSSPRIFVLPACHANMSRRLSCSFDTFPLLSIPCLFGS